MSPKVSLDQIKAEKIKREMAHRRRFRSQFSIESKSGFWKYCKYMDSEFFYEEKGLLKGLCHVLQLAAQGKYKKIIIAVMPRIGKSYTISLWCTWMLGHNPKGSIMRNAYGARLANKFSRDIRNIIGQPGEIKSETTQKYLRVFPHMKLAADRRSVEEWALDTAKDVSYFCGGVGGPITGYGCNLAMILDDPIKNSEEANSDYKLETIEEWYLSTHKTRRELGSDCIEIIIMTRWSIRDTAGMRLELEPGKWKEFVFPALTEEGKSISEETASTKELLGIRQGLFASGMEHTWYSLYMQEPIEKEGLLYPPQDLHRYKKKDLHMWDYTLGYVDFADTGIDFLCSLVTRVIGKRVYVVDVVFTRKKVEDSEPLVVAQYLKYKPIKSVFESNNGGRIYALNIKRAIYNFLKTSIIWIPNESNKETRILTWSGIVKETFYFLDSTEYETGSDYHKFMKNLTTYKKSGKNKNDDAPDACTGMATMLGVKADVVIKLFQGEY